MDAVCSGPKGKRSIQTAVSNQSLQPESVVVWSCISVLSEALFHFCDGSINAEKLTCAAFKTTSFPGKTTLCTHSQGLDEEDEGTACSPDLSPNGKFTDDNLLLQHISLDVGRCSLVSCCESKWKHHKVI